MYLRENTLLQGGKYKIVRYISSGGFGNTYEAYHVLLKKKVAIKEFFAKSFCNRDKDTMRVVTGVTSKAALVRKLLQKFIQEAQSVSSLKHPNIVNVHDVFEENNTAYFVMDYIDGMSLMDKLKNGVLGEQVALKYIRQVADALSYVHSSNRLHLDIKPGNIMIDEHDNAILIDFGASKQYDEVDGENTSTLLGVTPGFAPLEQMGNDVMKFFPSTDIYALGATLYSLLTGITPPSAVNLASGVAELKPLPATVSQNVKDAILQAMLLKKSDRPQSIDEFLELLDAPLVEVVEDGDDTIGRAGGDVTIASSRKKKDDGKTIKTIGMCVATALIAFFAVFVIMNRAATTDDPGTDVVVEQEEAQAEPQAVQVTGVAFMDIQGNSFTYTGETLDGKPNGTGTGVYSYGNYSGEYKDGMRHGKGEFSSKDGANHYEGTFAADKYDNGKLTLSTGEYFVGKFKDGNPYEGIWYTKDGKEDGKVKEGQELK